MSPPPLRIAMWSGPRNISTAMMRSFANRPDTAVIDEPLYGVYLAATGVDHPGRAEILAAMPTDWRVVVAGLTGPIPDGRSVFYQKHMAHHLLAEIDRAWLGSLRHAFLIRRPAAMLASYWRTRGEVTLTDTGLPQQLRLFEEMAGTTGTTPPVVDAADVLRDPEGMLRRLCAALGLAFLPAMLAWPPGPRTTDGVWARHWYGAVEASQGFAPYRAEDADLPPALADLAEECEGYYRQLHAHRLRAQA